MTSLAAPPIHEMTALQLRGAAAHLMADIDAASIHFSHSMPPEAVEAVKAGIIRRLAAETALRCAMPEDA